MQRRNTALLFAVVAIALLAAVVWRLATDDPELLVDPDGGQPPALVPDSPDPLPGNTPVAVPFAGPRVVVSVRSQEKFVPPRPSRVQAVQLPHRDPLPTTMLAGTGSNPWTDELRPGVALVEIETDGGFLVRQVGVEATGVAELGLGSMLMVTGRVQDEAGKPLARAGVYLGERGADGKNRFVDTDPQGAFEVRVRASSGVPLVVGRYGYAGTYRMIRVDVDSTNDHTISLVPMGRLTVQIAGQAENLGFARVFAVPAGPRGTELSRWPFFHWSAGVPVNGAGRCDLPLPQRGTVGITVMHPQVAIGRPHEVALDGERTSCTVPLEFSPAWTSALSNDAGEPLASARLLLRPGGRRVRAGSGLLLLPPQLEATGCFYAESDAEGRFVCATPQQGDVLSLRAPGHAGRDIEIGDTPPGSLWLPRWTGGDLAVHLQPPLAGAPWRAEFDLGGGTVIDCGADEVAVVSLPHYGLFDIVVTTYEGSEKRGEREHRGVSATGPVVVPAPPIE